MNDFLIPPFYVGQEVVAIKDHSQGAFKKGDEFKVSSIEIGCCAWVVTVGILSVKPGQICMVCGHVRPARKESMFKAYLFAPKIEISSFISMKELADKQFELISAN